MNISLQCVSPIGCGILLCACHALGRSDSVHGSHWELCASRGSQDSPPGWTVHSTEDQGVNLSGSLHVHDRHEPGGPWSTVVLQRPIS